MTITELIEELSEFSNKRNLKVYIGNIKEVQEIDFPELRDKDGAIYYDRIELK